MGAYCQYVTFGAPPKTDQKTSPPWRIDLLISEALNEGIIKKVYFERGGERLPVKQQPMRLMFIVFGWK